MGQPDMIDISGDEGYSCTAGIELNINRHDEEMQRTKAPFRTDQVGSLLRPPALKQARSAMRHS